jgi:OHCU decarboxylase
VAPEPSRDVPLETTGEPGGGPPATLTMAEVDELDAGPFVSWFGHVYEDAPDLALAVWSRGPHHDIEGLARAFSSVLDELDDEAQIALLRAHPQLGARTLMTVASTTEQSGAGLDRIDEEVRAELADGNDLYLERFGFPFIVAVKGLGVDDIRATLRLRLGNDAVTERATAVEQVRRIGRLRLDATVAP